MLTIEIDEYQSDRSGFGPCCVSCNAIGDIERHNADQILGDEARGGVAKL
jgi:hypothetical protein